MRIAFAGSATNPSHLGHALLLRIVLFLGWYDLVIWHPSGFSDYKPNLLAGIHRQQMAHLAFPQNWIFQPQPGQAKLLLDLSATMTEDVPTALRFLMLHQQYPGAEITFITGSDSITPGEDGSLPILNWHYPEILLQEKILVIPRSGFALPQDGIQLPSSISWLDRKAMPDVRSSRIREMIARGDPTWKRLVNSKVRKYIELHNLYVQGGVS
jgi:nicotinic acid mononucleotide adenylyltransferase